MKKFRQISFIVASGLVLLVYMDLLPGALARPLAAGVRFVAQLSGLF